MLAVVCYYWGTRYRPEHVIRLQKLVAEHLPTPHRFVVASDTPNLPVPHVVPLPIGLASLGNAYPKLQVFRPDAAELFGGSRILLLDLDIDIKASLEPLVSRQESIVLCPEFIKSPCATHYNSSVLLMTAGAFPEVWRTFHPIDSPFLVTRSRKIGSDQVWLSMKLGPDRPTFGREAGIRSYRLDYLPNGPREDDRVIVFHGSPKPWELDRLAGVA